LWRSAGGATLKIGGGKEDRMALWTAVDWRVEEANASEFPKRWEEMLRWAKDNTGTLDWARLVRDAEDPTHYISMASWHGDGPRAAIEHEEFQGLIKRCEELCRESMGGPGEEIVTI
jgi:hypothetical protein